MFARSHRWAVAAAAMVLAAAPARAADITFVTSAQTTAASTRTMRIPRTGTFSMPALASGYLIVAVGIDIIDYQVDAVTWESTSPRGTTAQALHATTVKSVSDPETCRTELWALAKPLAGEGFVTVTVKSATSSPMPSLAGSILAFANVGSTSTNGPCCAGATNSGSGTSTINKTMLDTSRGDALVNAVCTSWNQGMVPGMPGPDPANDPEMVPRTLQSISNMQHFTGTSPGGDADAPATGYRHLRWLQTGSRSWAIAGLSLHAASATPPPPDAAASPPDSAIPPSDAAAPREAAATPADTAMPSAPDGGTPFPETPSSADAGSTARPDVKSGPPLLPSPDVEAGPLHPEPDADRGQRQVSLQVGCACRTGAPGGGGGLALALLALLLVRRRDDSRRLP
jgi:MYXO-CTERM domain-containing protein